MNTSYAHQPRMHVYVGLQDTRFCISQVRLRSAKTSHLGSVYVTMVNGTGGSVTAWWVDFDGNEVRSWLSDV